MSLYFYSEIERIAARYEARTGKVHFIHKAVYGNCRIVNLNEVLKNPDLYVVMGELIHNKKRYLHLWAAKDCKHSMLTDYIVDKTKKFKEEIRNDTYFPVVCLKINEDCKVTPVWSILDSLNSRERIVYKKFFAYIETFCIEKKMQSK